MKLSVFYIVIGNEDFFLRSLESILDHMYEPNLKFIVCGDFNIDTLTDNDMHSKLLNSLSHFNVGSNIVKWHTR